ncbi:MAG: SPOR domain-containing protein [Phycisphaerales bacterium]|nr:MAG: SPOR domain-containing protein [Phycisphaerales bacterium]
MPTHAARTTRRPARLAALAVCAVSITLGACESTPKSGGSRSLVEDYEAGRYAVAYALAAQEAARTTGTEREAAALVAGLSAQAMDRNDDAAKWLTPLTTSTNFQIAGRANAGMGLVELSNNRPARAAQHFRTASTRLTGDDAARASYFAGEAYTMMGKPDEARKEYAIAQATAQDPALRERMRGRASGVRSGSYSLQVGAYSDPVNAQRAAREVAHSAHRNNLGEPRVVSRSGPAGGSLYIVQIGRFGSRVEADAARLNLGSQAIVAAAIGDAGS